MQNSERKIFIVADSEHSTSNNRLPLGNDVVRRTCFPASTDLEEFVVERDEQLSLNFVGRLVGTNVIDKELPRGTWVRIFVTRAGSLVTSVHQWQRGRGAPRERHVAAVHNTPGEALTWLVEDGKGRLGPASCEAWRMACEVHAALRGYAVEVVP
jgi:hypothetical protein